MTRDEFERCARLIAGTWPSGSGAWSEDTLDAWESELIDMDVGLVVGVIKAIATEGREFAPTAGQVRQRAAQLALKLPSADEAWGEVQQQVRKVGSLRGTMRWERDGKGKLIDVPIEPVWSHPLIGQVADNIGWAALWQSENEVADRAHFFRVWNERVGRECSRAAMSPATVALLDQAGISLPSLSIDRAPAKGELPPAPVIQLPLRSS